MKIKQLVSVLLLCLLWVSPAMAFDFNELFGSDLLFEVAEEEERPSLAETMLINEGVEVGGKYNLSVSSDWNFKDDKYSNRFRTNLSGNLFLDARPDPNYRVFANVQVNYGQGIYLSELFSDFNYQDKIFFRGGKQTINWGVGYFFSPADVINVGKIDPQNPEEPVEGPIALKINMPVDIHNYYLYLLFNDVEEINQIAIAPKVEFVVGRSEVGLGGYYQKEQAPRLMATISSSIKGVSLFGEAMISNGSDKRFVEKDSLLGLKVVEKEQLFFKGTVGARFSRTDPQGLFSVAAAAQYYYNGEYLRDQSLLSNPVVVDLLLSTEDPRYDDLIDTGRHYFAATASWNKLLNTDYTLSGFWLGNLSDNSGKASATLSFSGFEELVPSIGISKTYGEPGSEFVRFTEAATTIFFNVSLGSGSF